MKVSFYHSNVPSMPAEEIANWTLADLAGKGGCWHVETRVKMTDMSLSGQRVADMLADMLAT